MQPMRSSSAIATIDLSRGPADAAGLPRRLHGWKGAQLEGRRHRESAGGAECVGEGVRMRP